MKRTTAAVWIVWSALALPMTAAAAPQEINTRGEVAVVDAPGHFLRIGRTNVTTGKLEKFDLTVPAGTVFHGVTSLDQLETGKQVQVDAVRDPSNGHWETKAVTLV
jgi:hypothetical protein